MLSVCSVQIKTYPTLQSLTQRSHLDLDGTMYFVTNTGSLYLKVPGGWKEIQVITLVFDALSVIDLLNLVQVLYMAVKQSFILLTHFVIGNAIHENMNTENITNELRLTI